MELNGKVALITGAGSGIGRALAQEAASRGLRLMIAGRRQETLDETLALLPAGTDAVAVPADINDDCARAELKTVVAARFGRLNLLVNNAGVQTFGAFADMDPGQIRAMVETNLLAPMCLTQSMLSLLRAGTPARIVNIGSMFGDIAFPWFAGYSATKFGMRGFSDALRRELLEEGIGVTYAAPRATRTPAQSRSEHLEKPMKMVVDEPGAVARRILDAVAHDAARVYPRGMERLFVLLQQVAPGLIDKSLAKQVQAVRAISQKPADAAHQPPTHGEKTGP